MTSLVARALPFLLLLGSTAAAAEPESADQDQSTGSAPAKTDAPRDDQGAAAASSESHDDALVHLGQFGLRAGFLFGFKTDFRYPHSPLCKQFDASKAPNEQQKVCGYVAVPATELALSYAASESVEPFLFGRFGFATQSQTNTNPLVVLGLGVRLYVLNDSPFKLFVEPGLGWELEGGAGDPRWDQGVGPEYKKDMLIHLGIGPQYDITKNVGIYLNGAVDVGIFRALSGTMLANLGVQVRIP